MEIKFFEDQKLLIFKITEEIDECKVKEIRRRADYEIERFMPKRVVFDFNSVTFMDSAGIGMIIGRYKQAVMLGGQVYLANLTDSVRKIFAMSGVLKLIPEVKLYNDEELEENELTEKSREFYDKEDVTEEKEVSL